MQKTVLMSLLLLSSSLMAQKKCDYSMDKTDDFTKVRQVRTTKRTLFDNKGGAILASALANTNVRAKLSVQGANEGGHKYLGFFLALEDDTHGEGFRTVQLLLTNDSVVTFNKHSAGNMDVNADAVQYWKYYPVQDDQWSMLSAYSIKSLRLHLDHDRVQTKELKGDEADAVKFVITCVNAKN